MIVNFTKIAAQKYKIFLKNDKVEVDTFLTAIENEKTKITSLDKFFVTDDFIVYYRRCGKIFITIIYYQNKCIVNDILTEYEFISRALNL